MRESGELSDMQVSKLVSPALRDRKRPTRRQCPKKTPAATRIWTAREPGPKRRRDHERKEAPRQPPPPANATGERENQNEPGRERLSGPANGDLPRRRACGSKRPAL